MKDKFLAALAQLKKQSKLKPRKFDQSADLIINLRDFDVRRESISTFVLLPHKAKEIKVCGFFDQPSEEVDKVITKKDVAKLKEKEIASIAKQYDWFIAVAPLMPAIAAAFGKILGPAGKMPNPKAGGVIPKYDARAVKSVVDRLKRTVAIRTKEASIKVSIGKESMPDEQLAENAAAVYDATIAALPKKKQNVKNVLLKLTMSKPIKV